MCLFCKKYFQLLTAWIGGESYRVADNKDDPQLLGHDFQCSRDNDFAKLSIIETRENPENSVAKSVLSFANWIQDLISRGGSLATKSSTKDCRESHDINDSVRARLTMQERALTDGRSRIAALMDTFTTAICTCAFFVGCNGRRDLHGLWSRLDESVLSRGYVMMPVCPHINHRSHNEKLASTFSRQKHIAFRNLCHRCNFVF